MKFTAEELENYFKKTALSRIIKKSKGNKKYEKDAGYWTGGKCNWGGSHNLKEDCETLVRNLNKLDDLKTAKKELESCTSSQEFESVKQRLIRQAEELERGLQAKIDYTADDNRSKSNSVFGICVIWDNYQDFTENRIRSLKKEVTSFKDRISQEKYKYYEELRLLKLEQKKVEDRIKENKAKSEKETDPAQKALLLQMIEDDGKKLKENLEKQKAIPTSDLTFNPDKYVSNLIKGIEKNKNNNSANPDSSDDDSDTDNNSENGNNNTSQNFFQTNQPLIFGAIAILLIYYFYTYQEEEPNYYDF